MTWSRPGDAARLPAGLMRLSAGEDRRVALSALAATVEETHSLGLIRIDSEAALSMERDAAGTATENSVLSQVLGLMDEQGPLQPQLSPENVVLVGLREATPAEAAVLKPSRSPYSPWPTSMRWACATSCGKRSGSPPPALRDSMSAIRRRQPKYRAGRTAPAALTVRETHQAMEMIALAGWHDLDGRVRD